MIPISTDRPDIEPGDEEFDDFRSALEEELEDFGDDYDDYGEDFESSQSLKDRGAHRKANRRPGYKAKMSRSELVKTVTDEDETFETGFETSYKPSRHERGWIYEALSGFYLQGDISDVLRMVKGGKEACVYQCVANPNMGREFVAAKIYRPRRLRNLRNDELYRFGRDNLDADGKHLKDDRGLRAIQKGTDRGKALAHTSWLAHELGAMQVLFDAGADVPEPLGSGSNVILMDYIGDQEAAAPTLNHVEVDIEEAPALFARVLANIEIMLKHDIVHGDLSAYNILYQDGEITLIDFPQVIDPNRNPSARKIFDRDVKRICQYFAQYGLDRDPAVLAEEMWHRDLAHDPWSDPNRLLGDLSMADYKERQSEWDDEEDDDDDY